LAPLDGDHGGTWAAVNDRGVALFLLNGFRTVEPAPRVASPESRGLIPLSLIDSATAAEAAARLRTLDLDRFPPFLLALFERGSSPRLASWSGIALDSHAPLPSNEPLVSSSFLTDKVRTSRVAVYRRIVADRESADRAALHHAYHRSHEPSRGPLSPCMHRPEARTVSSTHLRVDRSGARLSYVGHPPCSCPEPASERTLTLPPS
jgi:hypothetical protein